MPLPTPKVGKEDIIRQSTFVADDDAVDAIADDIKMHAPSFTGATDLEVSNALYKFAIYCADNGCSDKQAYRGSTYINTDYALNSTIAEIIRRHCTVRQLCGYYARNVWNYLLENGPPMNWEKKNFTPATKYAAFDFFDAVSVKTAVSPATLVREPTLDEINANKTNAHAAIVSSRISEGTVFSTNAVVHGGRASGSAARYNFPYAMPSVNAP
jgi:hypothetical protein